MERVRVANIEATKMLIKTYESISHQMIKKAADHLEDNGNMDEYDAEMVASELTGYGMKNTCVLCLAVKIEATVHCNRCIHVRGKGIKAYDDEGVYCLRHHTYIDIDRSKNDNELLFAIKARAKYLQSLVDDYERDPYVNQTATTYHSA